jgi:DNA (cytosine-5)-methyltransferase 1
MGPAYYNEIDPFAAQWLRNLIAAGHLPPGDVDERSICDVSPSDLRGYGACHFFAGIGGWPLALRMAGVPDDAPVWTGSCPCQPFSAAGEQKGKEDERHLWPAFRAIIAARRPEYVFGEQVASAIAHGWIDDLQADLEGEGYAVGYTVLGAHSVGAPHIRQRLYWGGRLADADRGQRHGIAGGEERFGDRQAPGRDQGDGQPERGGEAGGVADAVRQQQHGGGDAGPGRRGEFTDGGAACRLGHADDAGLEGRSLRDGERAGQFAAGSAGLAFWSRADPIPCRDGKYRLVEPGVFPLAHGATGRVGRLRAYGSAIVPQVGAAFVRAFLAC